MTRALLTGKSLQVFRTPEIVREMPASKKFDAVFIRPSP